MIGRVERTTVQLRGVPLGELWLTEGDLVIATLERTEAYAGFAAEIRSSSERLWELGFLIARRPRVAVEALAPPAELPFELRDDAGRSVAVDFVNVVASPRANEPPVVVVHRKHVRATVASVLRQAPGGGRTSND